MPAPLNDNGINRRRFLQFAATGVAGAACGSAVAAKSDVAPSTAPRTSSVFAYGYDAEPYPLPTGPHLFIDWRYVQSGRFAALPFASRCAPPNSKALKSSERRRGS